MKKLSLELGGNAPFIVFDDADLDAAVEGAIASKYRNAGQTCVCANRIYVQDGVYDAFAEKLADEGGAAQGRRRASRRGVQQGPLIDASALDKVEEHVADAVAKGARVVTGGKRHALGGTFFEPTVLAGRDAATCWWRARRPSARWRRCSASRPTRRRSRLANDTEFGLAAYFYARDVGRVWRVAEALEYGMVGVNTGIISTEVAPFGGVKQSGIGREGSKYGIDEYLEMKYVCIGGV